MAIVIGESGHSQFQGTSALLRSLDKHVLSLIAPPSIAPCMDAVGICTNAVALTLLLVIYVNIFIKYVPYLPAILQILMKTLQRMIVKPIIQTAILKFRSIVKTQRFFLYQQKTHKYLPKVTTITRMKQQKQLFFIAI